MNLQYTWRKDLGMEILPLNQHFPSSFSPHCNPQSTLLPVPPASLAESQPCVPPKPLRGFRCQHLPYDLTARATPAPAPTGTSALLPKFRWALDFLLSDKILVWSLAGNRIIRKWICQTAKGGLVLVCCLPFVFIYFCLLSNAMLWHI